MNTISTKGSNILIKKYLEKGGAILKKHYNDNILKSYIDDSITLGLKDNTIVRKLISPYLFMKYIRSVRKLIN